MVDRQTAPSQNSFTPPPARDLMMLLASACCLALAAWASVSKTATPTVTATSSLV
ncbi:hypothetical protein SHIRM173S_05230 [Streptomyces hirsutus]